MFPGSIRGGTSRCNRSWRAMVMLLTFVAATAAARPVRASDLVRRGFDLYDPLPGTIVALPGVGLVPFVGVPLGTFDFGSGPVPTLSTDTVIQRLEDATAPMDFVPLLVLAMQLRTQDPIDLGSGLDFYFLTLQTGTPSDGTMIFTDFGGPHVPPPAHGSFRYDPINWFFDVRKGSLAGPIVLSGSKTLTSANTAWTHFPPPGAVLIPGVNYLLDGTQLSDFFPEPFALTSDDGTRILMQTAVPEPAATALLGLAAALVAGRMRRSSGRHRSH